MRVGEDLQETGADYGGGCVGPGETREGVSVSWFDAVEEGVGMRWGGRLTAALVIRPRFRRR